MLLLLLKYEKKCLELAYESAIAGTQREGEEWKVEGEGENVIPGT